MNNTFVSNCERHYLINIIIGGYRLDGRKLLFNQNVSFSCILGFDTIFVNIFGSLIQLFCSFNRSIFSKSFERFFDYSASTILIYNNKSLDVQPSILRTLEGTLQIRNCLVPPSIRDLEDKMFICNTIMNIKVINRAGFILDSLCSALIIWHNLFNNISLILENNEKVIRTKIGEASKALSFIQIPYTFNFGIMDNLNQAIEEPNYQEEVVIDGKLVIGINLQKELMTLKLSGPVSIPIDQVYTCSNYSTINLQNKNRRLEDTIKSLNSSLKVPEKTFGLLIY